MLTTEECQKIREQWSEDERGFMSNMGAAIDASRQIPALLDTIDELRAKLADLAEWCAELEHCAQEQSR